MIASIDSFDPSASDANEKSVDHSRRYRDDDMRQLRFQEREPPMILQTLIDASRSRELGAAALKHLEAARLRQRVYDEELERGCKESGFA